MLNPITYTEHVAYSGKNDRVFRVIVLPRITQKLDKS